MSGDSPVVLSPDWKQYWDGKRWRPALLSPDGKQCWNGSRWLPIAAADADEDPGPRPQPRPGGLTGTQPHVAAVAVAGGAATMVMLVGAVLPEGPKKLVEVVATLPILLIHTIADSFKERRLVLASPGELIDQVRSKAQEWPWWVAAAMLGGALALFDNVVLVILKLLVGQVALVLAVVAAIVLGVFVSRRGLKPGLGIVVVMGYTASLFNSVVVVILNGDSLGFIPLGVITGGTALVLLGLAGYIGDRYWRGRAARSAARAQAQPASPDTVRREVVLAEAGHVYWDGTEWRPVVKLSEDRRYVWTASSGCRLRSRERPSGYS